MRDGFVQTGFGRLHYLEQGAGPVLVLVHSNGQSGHSFREVAELLAPHFRVIAMDLPGQGDSDPLKTHLSIDDYADAVIALMDALAIPRAHVGGTSIGGFIAISLGVRHAARIDRLVVMEALLRDGADWAKAFSGAEKMFCVPTQTVEEVTPRLNIPVTPEIFTRWNIDRNKAGAWSMIQVMWAIRQYDVMANFSRLGVPTLALVGGKGNVQKTFEDRKALLPPCVQVRKIANSSHFIMMDNPKDLAAAIIDFCDG